MRSPPRSHGGGLNGHRRGRGIVDHRSRPEQPVGSLDRAGFALLALNLDQPMLDQQPDVPIHRRLRHVR